MGLNGESDASASHAVAVRRAPLLDWARKTSLWPVGFDGHGCPSELLNAIERELPGGEGGASPRQADVLLVAGRVPIKLLPAIQRVWQQMPEPKWCIALGCDDDDVDTYALVRDIEAYLPVDIAIPDAPPTREALLEALERLRGMVGAGSTPAGSPGKASEGGTS